MTFLGIIWWMCKLAVVICIFVIIMCVLIGLIQTMANMINPPKNIKRRKISVKAHIIDTPEYDKYRNENVTIGEVLDIYDQAKVFMVARVTKEHGNDVAKWPSEVSREIQAAFSASDMIKDIMMAIYKQQKDIDAASKDEHSPVYEEETVDEDKE